MNPLVRFEDIQDIGLLSKKMREHVTSDSHDDRRRLSGFIKKRKLASNHSRNNLNFFLMMNELF